MKNIDFDRSSIGVHTYFQLGFNQVVDNMDMIIDYSELFFELPHKCSLGKNGLFGDFIAVKDYYFGHHLNKPDQLFEQNSKNQWEEVYKAV